MRGWRIVSLGLLVTGAGLGQSGATGARFVSASIQADNTSPEQFIQLALRGQAAKISGNEIDLRAVLGALVARAFRIETQDLEGPDAALQQRFVIHAVMPPGATREQVPEMLRALLEDKLHLEAHRLTRQVPGYFLETNGQPLKLGKPMEMDRSTCSGWAKGYSDPISDPVERMECAMSTGERGAARVTTVMVSSGPWGAFTRRLGNDSQQMEIFSATMPQLAKALSAEVEVALLRGTSKPGPQVVVDRTGISGEWDVVLDGARWWRNAVLDRNLGAPASDEADGVVALSGALEKVGLKIEKGMVPVEKVVVERVDLATGAK